MPSLDASSRSQGGFSSSVDLSGLRIVHELGRGELGVVHLAEKPGDDQPLALKVLSREASADPEQAARYLEQVLAAARLPHQGILPVLDARKVAGVLCVIMAYRSGGSLQDLLRNRPLRPGEAAMVGSQVAGALHVAHRSGIVHGDLRPSNILFSEEGMPWLSDFGMTALTGFRPTTPATGVVEYLAPEQTPYGEPTPATDVYALGVMLYEALAGRPPYRGSHPDETMAHHRYQSVPPFPESTPAELAEVIQTALARLPGGRFADAGTFASALVRSTLNRRLVQIGPHKLHAANAHELQAPSVPRAQREPHAERRESPQPAPARSVEAPEPDDRPAAARAIASAVWRHAWLFGVLGGLGVLALVWVWVPLPGGSARAPAPAPTISGQPLEIQDLPAEPPHATAAAAPSDIRISRIGVDARVVPLTLEADGTVPTPSDPGTVGWVTASPVPGGLGPSLLVGHLDSYTGPAVFWRLGQLHPGDLITIRRADGSTVDFAVSRVARYPSDAFPNAEVYGPTANPEVRLITCTGAWDWGKRQYQDRTVVYGTLAP